MNKDNLTRISKSIRKDIIQMIYESKSGHPGGSLSCTDILTYLYFNKMTINPSSPNDEKRDRLVLSKGHAAPALYAVLAEKGFFDKKELRSLRKLGAMLQGHPDAKKIPGVDVSTGSLGQGISNATGMALGLKCKGGSSKVYAILGDGELQEGIVWEASMAAAHYKLNNLIAIIDHNGLQIDGENEKVMGVEPIDEKFKSFGWHTIKCNGNDYESLHEAFTEADKSIDKPVVIIARTIKGKGVSFMENEAGWHGQAPNSEQTEKAIEDIEG